MKNNSLTTMQEIRSITTPIEKEETQEELLPGVEMELPQNIVIEICNGTKIAVGQEISASDYLLFLEKSLPPRKPGSSARAIGGEAAIAWLISQAYTIDDEPLTGFLMDKMQLDIKDFNALLGGLLSIVEEVDCNDDVGDVIDSRDFTFKGRRVTRDDISWRYGIKLQSSLSEGKQYEAFQNLFMQFWKIDGEKITKQMMDTPESEGGVGVQLATIIVGCLRKLLT